MDAAAVSAALDALRPVDLIADLARLRRARDRAAAAGEWALACEYALRVGDLECARDAQLRGVRS
jgi:hypothetical protein